MLPYLAVLDVETTGFNFNGYDRIVEIGVVRLDGNGHITDEYETLVNPERDVGPTHVHGITAAAVAKAPRFVEIAGDVLNRLMGAVVVGHNVRFDLGFIQKELGRVGIGNAQFPNLCTIALSRTVLPGQDNRKLQALCRRMGVKLAHAHAAMDDARATALLLDRFIEKMGGWDRIRAADLPIKNLDLLKRSVAPAPESGVQVTRQAAQKMIDSESSGIGRLMDGMEHRTDRNPDIETDEYLELLDRVLEDRRVTQDEVDSLKMLAQDLGLNGKVLDALHRAYLEDLVLVAWSDGVVTPSERKDIKQVAKLLNIASEQVDVLIDQLRPLSERQIP
ncbi:MAG: DNA polymerase III subunit epsilon, partial [Deltaproteobacteria bacterium]|nr:DNA polymerase III subunit epsilon [Deltaproteobacteria bacterium]